MKDSVPSLNSVTRETNKLLEVRAVVCDDDLGLNGFDFDISHSFEAIARDFSRQTQQRYRDVPILVSLLLINDPRASRWSHKSKGK